MRSTLLGWNAPPPAYRHDAWWDGRPACSISTLPLLPLLPTPVWAGRGGMATRQGWGNRARLPLTAQHPPLPHTNHPLSPHAVLACHPVAPTSPCSTSLCPSRDAFYTYTCRRPCHTGIAAADIAIAPQAMKLKRRDVAGRAPCVAKIKAARHSAAPWQEEERKQWADL